MPNLFPAPPAIDDRRFEDLVAELLARVPAHTPEWNPQQGDPGRTLIELFAWLSDTILYRANLIPEKQRLAFLDLLGKPLQAAKPARGLMRMNFVNPVTDSQIISAQSLVPGPVNFETTETIKLMPVTGECYYKRELDDDEKTALVDVLDELKDFHELDDITGYVTERAFDPDVVSNTPLDVATQTVDNCLWLALLAPAPANVAAVKATLAGEAVGSAQQLAIGFDPGYQQAETLDDIQLGGEIGFTVSISSGELDEDDNPVYIPLDITEPTESENNIQGLTQLGVFYVTLPANAAYIGLAGGDVRSDHNAGVGARPPRLDDPVKIARTVCWLKIEFESGLSRLPVDYLGVNCAPVAQRTTIKNQLVGQSNGAADQIIQLPWKHINSDTLRVEVEESGRGFVPWYRVDDIAETGRDDNAYVLNSALGTLQFGNGIFGRIVETGRRIRIASAVAGGGVSGNLPRATLKAINAKGPDGSAVAQPLSATQVIATSGGFDAETLAEAERRIPAWLKHRNRSVVSNDYQELAKEVPGVSVGRVEVLPKFLPQQRRENVPGVVSVMVLPEKDLRNPPTPRADKPLIEKVYRYLEARKPVATELYVIGCEYVPIALSVAVSLRQGFARDQVLYDVKVALKDYLWSLAPFGPFGEGWPLGRPVRDREMEVVAARVAGVKEVAGVNVFVRNGSWKKLPRTRPIDPQQLDLETWQLPELLGVVVSVGDTPEENLTGLFGSPKSGEGESFTAVPVIPEVC